MTFPGGTHDLWIRYWLAAGGIDPDKDIETIVVPPAQMVANMKVGTMDAFCVCEPWNLQLIHQNIGYTALTTGELWDKHPEKSFGMRAAYVDKYPKAAKALLMAVMEAQQWCDKMENREETAAICAKRQWINVPVEDVTDRMKGKFDYGTGRVVENSPQQMRSGRTRPRTRSRATISGSSPRTSAGASMMRASMRSRSSPRSTAKTSGRTRPRTSASRLRIFRLRRRAARRPSSTARSSIRKTRLRI
jgi:hypothetical protein